MHMVQRGACSVTEESLLPFTEGGVMKKVLLVAAAVMLLFSAQSGYAQRLCCHPDVDIMAGQHMDVGDILYWIDGDFLYITYQITEEGWYLKETHLSVVCDDPDLFPMTRKGNPIPGHFAYKTEHDPYVTEYTYMIEGSDFPDDCMVLFIAAHAEVVLLDEYGQIIQEETGWGGCIGDCCFEFRDPTYGGALFHMPGGGYGYGNWATYFAFGRLNFLVP